MSFASSSSPPKLQQLQEAPIICTNQVEEISSTSHVVSVALVWKEVLGIETPAVTVRSYLLNRFHFLRFVLEN